jgi:sarcosine oxidase subunit beta
MAKRSADAVIIGSGIIGNSISTELARRGWRTLCVDKLAGPGSGSTSWSSGILRTTYSIIDSVKFAWEGFSYYDNWADHIRSDCEGGLAHVRRCGQVILRSSAAETFLSKTVACHEELGLPFEEWDAATLRERCGFELAEYGPPRRIDDEHFGTPRDGTIDSAVYFPLTGYVSDPQLAARNLRDAALATGNASFRYGATVTAITRAGGRAAGVALSDGSTVEARVVINAAGPHSSAVNALAFPEPAENDMALTTRPMRQEVAHVRVPAHGSAWRGEGIVVTDVDSGIYFRPEPGGKLLIGSTEPECDRPSHRFPFDPEATYPGGDEAGLTEQWTNQVYRAALRMPSLPLPDAASTQGAVAYDRREPNSRTLPSARAQPADQEVDGCASRCRCYDVTEDWTPIYDKSALPGYFLAIGTSGNQFKNAGVAGRLVAELVEASEGGRDLDAQPLQFALERVPGGHVINAATFSRLRARLDTSASVLG